MNLDLKGGLFIMFVLLANVTHAQGNRSAVRKSVILLSKPIGYYRVEMEDRQSSTYKLGNLGLDNSINIMLPNDPELDVSDVLNDMQVNRLYYCFPEAFATRSSISIVRGQITAETGKSDFDDIIDIDFDSIYQKNEIWICNRILSSVAKIWVVDGEWEEFKMSNKPATVSGLMPRTMKFKQYRLYLLKKIISIKPIVDIDGSSKTMVTSKIGGLRIYNKNKE